MTEPDERIRRLYGTLPREEPPPALDAAVLVAARRAVARPSLVRRWGAPVSIAAVLVLVVGVTLEMQREQPGVETSVAPSPPPSSAAPSSPPAAAAPDVSPLAKPAQAPKAETRMKAKTVPRRPQPEPAPAAGPPPAAPEAKREASPSADALEAAPAGRMGAPAANLSSMKARAGFEDPKAELERIAKLRAEGKDEDADRALEEFRRRHPGYRIDDAAWERVKPR